MSRIELIFDRDCPNVPEARKNIRSALLALGLPLVWHEMDSGVPGLPDHVKGFGSPTILVDGQDIAGVVPGADANCCRIYRGLDGRSKGVPPMESIQVALERARSASAQGTSGPMRPVGILAGLTGMGAFALAGISCPACVPALAGVLSASGLGAIIGSAYLYPAALLSLTVCLFSLFFRARRRRGYAPALLGTIAAAMILLGRFHYGSDPLTYAGSLALFGAALWNVAPRGRQPCEPGVACT